MFFQGCSEPMCVDVGDVGTGVEGQPRRDTGGLTHLVAVDHDAHGAEGLFVRIEAAARNEQVFGVLRHERGVGDLIKTDALAQFSKCHSPNESKSQGLFANCVLSLKLMTTIR